jgi:hypothetical protein
MSSWVESPPQLGECVISSGPGAVLVNRVRNYNLIPFYTSASCSSLDGLVLFGGDAVLKQSIVCPGWRGPASLKGQATERQARIELASSAKARKAMSVAGSAEVDELITVEWEYQQSGKPIDGYQLQVRII